MENSKKMLHIEDAINDARENVNKVRTLMEIMERKCFTITDIKKKIPCGAMNELIEMKSCCCRPTLSINRRELLSVNCRNICRLNDFHSAGFSYLYENSHSKTYFTA